MDNQAHTHTHWQRLCCSSSVPSGPFVWRTNRQTELKQGKGGGGGGSNKSTTPLIQQCAPTTAEHDTDTGGSASSLTSPASFFLLLPPTFFPTLFFFFLPFGKNCRGKCLEGGAGPLRKRLNAASHFRRRSWMLHTGCVLNCD